jgi:hypothetical protein
VSSHFFVDESRRGGVYLLAAAEVRSTELAGTRSALRALCLPGMRRVHFQAEGDSRRRDLLSQLISTRSRVTIYRGRGPAEATRVACLRLLVAEVIAKGGRRLVLESRGEPGDRSDRTVIAATLRQGCADPDRLTYEHLRPHDEPALWIPDAAAWCHGAGGHWRLKVAPLIDSVIDVVGTGGAPRWSGAGQREARAPVVRRVPPGLTSST